MSRSVRAAGARVLVTGQAYQDPKDALNEFISNAADEYAEADRVGRIRVVLRRRGRPSAGLMFTLAYIDALTPGALVDDLRVAGTGGIGVDGVVIPVSNVEIKVAVAMLTQPDVIFTPTPSEWVEHTTIVGSEHTRDPEVGSTVGDWLNVAGYEQAGRDAANHPGTVAFVVVHDVRQALAWLCGRTANTTTCTAAHRSAGIPIGSS